jgi:hypothetical protein
MAFDFSMSDGTIEVLDMVISWDIPWIFHGYSMDIPWILPSDLLPFQHLIFTDHRFESQRLRPRQKALKL